MKKTALFTHSGSILLGIAAFTAASASIAGVNALTTVLGLAIIALYGIAAITVLSYSAPVAIYQGTRRTGSTACACEVVEFPNKRESRRAA